jgi:hypothetical protein
MAEKMGGGPPIWIETNWSVLSDVLVAYLQASEKVPGEVAKLVKSYQDLLSVLESVAPHMTTGMRDGILGVVRRTAVALPFPVGSVARQLIRIRAMIEGFSA